MKLEIKAVVDNKMAMAVIDVGEVEWVPMDTTQAVAAGTMPTAIIRFSMLSNDGKTRTWR